MKTSLLKALRAAIHADSSPTRQDIFNTLRQKNALINFVISTHKLLGKSYFSTAMVSIYGLKSLLFMYPDSSNHRPEIVSIASQKNARRRLAEIREIIGPSYINDLNVGKSAVLRLDNLKYIHENLFYQKKITKLFNVIHQINRRYDFLVSCRTTSVIGCYIRARRHLVSLRPHAVLFASDSNPEELGLIYSAQSLMTPTIFASHAYPTSLSLPLEYDLSILEGQAALEKYKEKSQPSGKAILAGLSGPSRPMNVSGLQKKEPVVGIFTPKTVNWPEFTKIINECHAVYNAQSVLIRWHPSLLERRPIKDLVTNPDRVIETSVKESAGGVAQVCDWVITDANSNVHLDVLKMGTPTISVEGMRPMREENSDIYGFVANGLIYPPVSSLAELDMQKVTVFYSGRWVDKFRYYDANYLRSHENYVKIQQDAIYGLISRNITK